MEAPASQETLNSHRQVLLPVDGSEHSERALHWYIKNLHRPEDHVTLLHCFDLPMLTPMTYGNPVIITQGEWNQLAEEKKAANKKLETKCIDLIKDHVKEHKFMLKETQEPGEAIVDVAHQIKANFIVMGNRGLGVIRRTFLGSVSDYVIHHAGLPISIVPPAK